MLFEEEDYRTAVERAGVRELPDDGRPAIAEATAPVLGPPDTTYATLLDQEDQRQRWSGHWVDNDPPGCPR